jgi:hypothetical protein
MLALMGQFHVEIARLGTLILQTHVIMDAATYVILVMDHTMGYAMVVSPVLIF